MVKRIERWSTELCPNQPYLAPELHDHLHLAGIIDGKEKLTSRIVKANGRTVTTKTGTVYELGDPRPEFAAWCAERGEPIDPQQPVKVRPSRKKRLH